MKLKSLLLGAALTLGSTVAASAGTVYATMVDYVQGGGTIASNRTIASNALGAPDSKFLSLGFGGYAVFSFGSAFTSPGNVVEVTFDTTNYGEYADIYVGNSYSGTGNVSDLGSFDFVASVDNVNAQASGGGFTFTFPGTYTYLAILDRTLLRGSGIAIGPNGDGFDIDSVSVNAVPVPAAGILLLGALGGLGVMRRRKKA